MSKAKGTSFLIIRHSHRTVNSRGTNLISMTAPNSKENTYLIYVGTFQG